MKTTLLLVLLAACYSNTDAEHDARRAGATGVITCLPAGRAQTFTCADQAGHVIICSPDGCILIASKVKP